MKLRLLPFDKTTILWLAAALVLPLGCSGPDYEAVRNRDSLGETIVFLGDSLTAGTGARPQESIPSILAPGLPLPVVNAGVPGDTTAKALSRLDRDVLSKSPRLVVVMLGGNDALRRVPKDETEENLRRIVRRCQEDGGAMVAVVALRLSFFGDSYSAIFEKVAEEEQALLIPDLWKGIAGKKEYMSDQVHPNAKGYALMAERLEPHLQTLLSPP